MLNEMKRSERRGDENEEACLMREKEVEGPQKKQVRRRLHSRKPYQEKLLNMAEARREIVSALKLHRASMKQKTQPTNSPHHFYNSNNYSWAVPPIFEEENLDFVLPDHPLGLNLNLDDFIATPPPSSADQFEFGELVRSPFDQVMEFPAWLNQEEEDHHLNHFSTFPHPPALPCMDIEEIEGMDGDWLA